MSAPVRPVARGAARALGIVGALVFVVGGLALLGLAVYMHFGVVANFNDHSKPDHVYGSAFDEPMVLTEPYGSYAVTSLRGPLDACQIEAEDGSTIETHLDDEIDQRPVFRFDAPAGTYAITCTPDLYFEVFTADDIKLAAQGYVNVHPSLYYLAGAAVALPIGSFLWNRFVMRPRDWPTAVTD